ncbi:MAG: hypothetical protein LUE21_07485, partial [Oscillospiraceae bacterium]|nr:hypothetical protein [Oscillospiraceae bacterium]
MEKLFRLSGQLSLFLRRKHFPQGRAFLCFSPVRRFLSDFLFGFLVLGRRALGAPHRNGIPDYQ